MNACWYCGKPRAPTFEMDHQIPRSQGGLGLPVNEVLACSRCNRAKGHMTVEVFRAHVAGAYDVAIERVTFFGETGISYPLLPGSDTRDEEALVLMAQVEPALVRALERYGVMGAVKKLGIARETLGHLRAGRQVRVGTLCLMRKRLMEQGFIEAR